MQGLLSAVYAAHTACERRFTKRLYLALRRADRTSLKHLVGEVNETVADYDLLSSIMICLGTKEDERHTGLLKLMDIWLSRNSIDEKRAALAWWLRGGM